MESPEDRELAGLLLGNEPDWSNGHYSSYSAFGYGNEYGGAFLCPAMIEIVLPRLCASGRFGWLRPKDSSHREELSPLAWDDGLPWRFRLNAELSGDRKNWQIRGELNRGRLNGGEETADLKDPLLLVANEIVVFRDQIARLDVDADTFQWIASCAARANWTFR